MILKLLNEGILQKTIAKIVGVDPKTVYNTKTNFLEHGLQTTLYNEPRSGRPIEIDERIRCYIASLVCATPPVGCDRWTLDLIVETLSDKENISISRESVRLVLKDHELKSWQQKTWCIPKVDDQFVKKMEDVLEVYERPYDPSRPVVCLDEKPVHLIGDKRPPVPIKEGEPRKVDYEYVRNGQASIFVGVEPKAGSFVTKTAESRSGIEFSRFLTELTKKYNDAEKIVLVMDNLNTHTVNSTIRAYGTEAGQELWEKFEVHYTPVHASWLNQAEIAISMLSRQCLGKTRTENTKILGGKVKAWTKRTNKKGTKINWKFTREKAREVFKLNA